MASQHKQLRETRLVKLFLSFTKSQRRQFKDFIQSPYFNKNEKLSKLYFFLYKEVNNINKPNFSLETAFLYLFPDEIYKKDTIIKLCSKLFKIMEHFVKVQHLEREEVMGTSFLLNYYNRHYLTELYQVSDRVARKLNDQKPYRNNAHYKRLFNIEAEYSKFLSIQSDNSTGDVNFQQMTNVLDVYYLSQKLEQLCQMKNRQQSVAIPYRFDLVEEILQFIPESPYFEVPIIQIWYYAFFLLDQPQLTHYQQLKQLIQQHNTIISLQEKRVLYTYLENSCMKIMSADQRYAELFDLYQLQLEDKTIYVGGHLLPMIFRNIITVALKLKEIDWATQFLERHQQLIVPDYQEREDMVSLCKALLLFEQKEYDHALDYLNQLEYNNIYTKLDERRIRLKIYYELNYEDTFDDLINSFRKFISTNKTQINEVYIELNRNFINIINTLNRLNIHTDLKMQLRILKEEIQGMTLLAEKGWLLEKLVEKA